jgi:hypothetical protein
MCALPAKSGYAPTVLFSVQLIKWFLSSQWDMLGFSPYTDIGSYLFIYGNVAALALNYIGWVSLVQFSNYSRSYTQAVNFMKLLVTFAIDISNSCGLAHL